MGLNEKPFKLIISLMMRLIVCLMLLSTSAFAQRAYELPLRHGPLDEGQANFGIGGSYFKTTSSFGESGQKEEMASGSSLQSIRSILFGSFSPLKNFSLFSHIDYVSNTFKMPATSGTASFSNSASGLGDADIGFRYSSIDTPIRFFVDGFIQFPLYKRLTPDKWAALDAQSTVPLGNGATLYGLGGTGELPVGENVFAGVGLNYAMRSAGFSNIFPYRVYVKYDEPKGLFGRIGLVGQFTAGEDQFTGTTNRERSRNIIGGSQAYNAINPTFLKAELAAGTYLGKSVFLNLGTQIPLTGKNSPRQPVYLAMLGFDLGGKAKTSEYTKSNRGFQSYYKASKVIQANNKLKLALIDKGRNDGIKIGEYLDIFEPDSPEGAFGETVARAKVIEAGPTRSKIQVMEYYKHKRIEEGFVVRRPVR